jgi:hypothetical protein
MKARGAHSSGVERVPLVSARTRPVILFAGQPATQRTANARTGWIAAVAFINLMIPNNGRVVGKQTHSVIIAQSESRRTVDRMGGRLIASILCVASSF